MHIQDRNNDIRILCSALNCDEGSDKYRIIYERNNALDFICNSEVKSFSGLEVDINSDLAFRLKYSVFTPGIGFTGYCLPMELVFKNLENNESFRLMNIEWVKNRLHPSIYHNSDVSFTKQVRSLSLNIKREVNNMLKPYILSSTLIERYGQEQMSFAALLSSILLSIIENDLILPNGKIRNSDFFSKIIFNSNKEFHFDELLMILHLHMREVGSHGSFINY